MMVLPGRVFTKWSDGDGLVSVAVSGWANGFVGGDGERGLHLHCG